MENKKLFLYLFAICLSFLLIPSISVFAYEDESFNQNFSDFQVNKNANEMIVKWNSIPKAKKYIVKHNHEILYEGTEAQFESKNLSEGSLNEYEIAAIDYNDQVFSNSHIKIYTTSSNNEEIGIDTFSTTSSIILDWPDVDNITEYYIYRDNQFIGVTKESHYIDNTPSANTEYQYTITGEIPFTNTRFEQIIEQVKIDFLNYLLTDDVNTSANNLFSQVYKEIEENPFDLIEISTPVKTLEENVQKISLQYYRAKPQIMPLAISTNTWIKINTMILNTSKYPGYIPAPIGSYYYGTDNRTTITSQGSTRSSLEASINWSTLAVEETKSIGWTNRYTKNSNGTYTFVDRKQASSNNVYLGATKKTSSMIDINFIHKAAHPYYTLAPNVEYEFRTEIYKDGTTKIRGYHTLFPSLGIFRSDGSGYKTIYTHDQGSRSPWNLYSHKTINITK